MRHQAKPEPAPHAEHMAESNGDLKSVHSEPAAPLPPDIFVPEEPIEPPAAVAERPAVKRVVHDFEEPML